MKTKNIFIGLACVVVLAVAAYFLDRTLPGAAVNQGATTTPQTQTLSETEVNPAPAQGKLNIDAVCRGALAYMTFPDAATADVFVADCKEGKHPEVIERYKTDNGLGDGAMY